MDQNQGQVDNRFDKASFDPRFKQISQKHLKTKLDQRFSKALKSKEFRLINHKDSQGYNIKPSEFEKEHLKELYYEENAQILNQEQEPKAVSLQKPKKNTKTQPQESKIAQKQQNQKVNVQAQQVKSAGLGKKSKTTKLSKISQEDFEQNPSNKEEKVSTPSEMQEEHENEDISSEKDEGSSSESLENFEWNEESSYSDLEEYQNAMQQEEEIWDEDENFFKDQPEIKETTNILAMVNYDWNNIKAQHIMVLMNSVKPQTGSILKVEVYPSEFGFKRMQEEELKGPQNIWKDKEVTQNKHTVIDDQGKAFKPEVLKNEIVSKVHSLTSDLDNQKLRKYELERLKYYYAVIYCDSPQTAEFIYENCNGKDLELSTVNINLSFVPKDLQFPYPLKEVCDFLPREIKSTDFVNRSIGHTNVKLTWDEPQMNRTDFLHNKDLFNEDKLKTLDLDQIIGDDYISESDQQPVQNAKEEEDNCNWRNNFNKKRKRSQEIEITFASGFEEQGTKATEKGYQQGGGFKAKQKQLRETLKQKHQFKKQGNVNDFFINTQQNEREREKLELLVDDKKDKQQQFNLDLGDSRFKKIFQDQNYAIDPTSKQFKEETTGKLLKEVVTLKQQLKKNQEKGILDDTATVRGPKMPEKTEEKKQIRSVEDVQTKEKQVTQIKIKTSEPKDKNIQLVKHSESIDVAVNKKKKGKKQEKL